MNLGLVLPGGGARGAYQVGVLRAIAEFAGPHRHPFSVISGVSAGAINAAVVASHAHQFAHGIARLEHFWATMRCHHIYRTDWPTIARTGVHWAITLIFGGVFGVSPRSFLDSSPLSELLEENFDTASLQHAIDSGALRGLAVTASGYSSARAVSFFQGQPGIRGWRRTRRDGVADRIRAQHLMASAALPFVFPAIKIAGQYYGDGSLRLTAPLSPAIRLGADRILIIGSRDERRNLIPEDADYPSLGELTGYMLDTLFMDQLNADIERANRINSTLALLSQEAAQGARLRPVETLVIKPSEDIRLITARHAHAMPRSIRTLLRGIGAWGGGWQLVSYLLFESVYTRALIDLGYADAQARETELRDFLQL